MKIILLVSSILLMGFNAYSASDLTKENVCVVLLTKGNVANSPARFDIQCGPNHVVGHAVTEFSQIENKEEFKNSLSDALKIMMTGKVSCEEHESESVWFSICKRIEL